MSSDPDLQLQVEKELAWDPAIHARQIGVTVRDASVHLAGHVDSYWERCAAEGAAWRIAHVRSVTNDLRVELPFASVREDDDLTIAAMTILEWNCLVPSTVDVHVADGVLTLSGTVAWHFQKVEAGRALTTLNGLKAILNDIRIEPTVALGDVKAPIDDALKRSALVNSGHIKATIHHGAVHLQGTAHSRAEHDEALRAAWCSPGVTTVDDHIAVG